MSRLGSPSFISNSTARLRHRLQNASKNSIQNQTPFQIRRLCLARICAPLREKETPHPKRTRSFRRALATLSFVCVVVPVESNRASPVSIDHLKIVLEQALLPHVSGRGERLYESFSNYARLSDAHGFARTLACCKLFRILLGADPVRRLLFHHRQLALLLPSGVLLPAIRTFPKCECFRILSKYRPDRSQAETRGGVQLCEHQTQV